MHHYSQTVFLMYQQPDPPSLATFTLLDLQALGFVLHERGDGCVFLEDVALSPPLLIVDGYLDRVHRRPRRLFYRLPRAVDHDSD